MEYNGYEIKRNQPHKRISWKIYKGEKFIQTCSKRNDAKRTIDFWIKHKLKPEESKLCSQTH